jgi:hypothetical protein
MWNKPTKKELSKMPALYSTDAIPLKEKVIHMHFFIGGCDWYVAEYDPEEQIFFGFAILNGDLEMAEWGNVSFKELCELKFKFLEVDRDLHWKPTKAKEIDKIREAERW